MIYRYSVAAAILYSYSVAAAMIYSYSVAEVVRVSDYKG